ncbi:MAG: hypothetical protein A3C47_02510 [Omnitrophica bacterium RIFCSPHIGHO2_02_FULL_51_18]|nr:MAG: hypothetical protein A3C47_02510 [Omnitrophica bacterium RIFCSPHIGHO2_02_FULL_51_18]
MKRSSGIKIWLWIIVLLMGLVNSLWAEDISTDKKEDASPNVLGELVTRVFDLGNILVSGKRLGSPLSDFVAESVSSTSVVTNEEIELSGAKNLPQAMQEVPGVVISDIIGNGEEPTLDFRGFNEGQDFVFLLGGVKLNEPKSNNINFPLIPLSLVERLEVSRGGASFLYGEGAMGGVTNIVARGPEPGFHGRARSFMGSFGEWGQNFEVSAKEDRVGMFMTGDLYHTQGFRQNTSVEKEDLYSKLVWDVTDKSQVSVAALYAEAHLDRSGSIRESRLRSLGPEATERPRNFSDLDTNLITADGKLALVDSVVLSGNVFSRRTHELSVANFATFETFDNELDLTVDTWGGALQIDHSKPVLWDFTEGILAGADYSNSAIDEEDFDRSKATLERLGQTVDSESDKESTGVFSKVSLSWNEKIGAYYGIRYDNIEFKNTDILNPDNNLPSVVSKISHAVGISYEALEDFAISGAWSKSFRAPTLADLYANPAFGGNPALKPEEASNYEVGMKLAKKNWTISHTLFMSHLTNEIGFDPNLIDAAHLFGRNNNFGKTERYGSETFVEGRVLPWLKARASHTAIQALFKSNTPTAEISGDHIPMVPRNRFTSSLLAQPLKDLDIQLSMLSVSKQVLTNDLTNDRNGRRLPAYTVFTLKTIYRWKGWELAFEVKNLFDEHYDIGGSLGAAPSPFNTDPTVEDNFFVPAPGRSYGGTVSCSF